MTINYLYKSRLRLVYIFYGSRPFVACKAHLYSTITAACTMSLLFSTIDVTRQCFFRAPSAIGIVNLKPILPGHVLVIPRRVVPRLSDLQPDEVAGLFSSVQTIGKAIEKAYQADALTIACQVSCTYGLVCC
jgi:diadenosine tetraphosphate (Ap4A) HIT family hydrolase